LEVDVIFGEFSIVFGDKLSITLSKFELKDFDFNDNGILEFVRLNNGEVYKLYCVIYYSNYHFKCRMRRPYNKSQVVVEYDGMAGKGEDKGKMKVLGINTDLLCPYIYVPGRESRAKTSRIVDSMFVKIWYLKEN